MRILKIIKLASLGVLLASLVFAVFMLSQPVRLRKSDYSAYDYQSSSATKPSASATKPSTSATKPTTSSASDMKIYSFPSVKIGVPTEYTSVLSVEKKAESGKTYNVLLRVYEKASKEASKKDLDETLGLLFEIGYVKISKYNDFKKLDYPGSAVFAKDSTNYYIYTEPTDYQFYRSNGGTSKEKDTWQTLQNIGSKVKTHFLKVNDVDSYTVKPDIQTPAPTTPIVTTPVVPVKGDCKHCEGSGACSHCLFGDCPSCYGRGECGSCGGSGYTYRGTGLNFRKVDCSRCNRSGDCSACNGRRYSECRSCLSSGNCSICGGSGFCEYCNGSGKQ